MKRIKALLLVAAILLGVVYQSEAQRFTKRKRYWSLGGSINAMNYVGDITASQSRFSVPFKFTRQNIGVCLIRRVAPRISYRGNFFYGRTKSSDRSFGGYGDGVFPTGGQEFGRYQRGAGFVNTVYELSGTVMIDFFENRGTWQKRPDYTPYAFLGLGAFYHNPKDLETRKPFKSTPWGSFSNFQGAALYGLGFRYKLDKRWDLALEIGWRITTTDMLDGVERGKWLDTDGWSAEDQRIYDKSYEDFGYYTDANGVTHSYSWISRPRPELSDKEAEKVGAARGDSPNDGYIVTGLHLTRILGGGVVCPKFR